MLGATNNRDEGGGGEGVGWVFYIFVACLHSDQFLEDISICVMDLVLKAQRGNLGLMGRRSWVDLKVKALM